MPSIFHGLLAPFVLRDLLRHPGISLLSALSIALGVAVYLAVQIASHSADQAFRAGMDMVSGKSHLEVRAGIGTLDEELFTAVQSTTGVAAATPIVEGHALLPDHPSEYLQLVGVDIFLPPPVSNFRPHPPPQRSRKRRSRTIPRQARQCHSLPSPSPSDSTSPWVRPSLPKSTAPPPNSPLPNSARLKTASRSPNTSQQSISAGLRNSLAPPEL